jgi:stress response protein YsnF
MESSSKNQRRPARRQKLLIPVVEESLSVDKRQLETDRIVLKKHVDEHEEIVDEPLFAEKVEVRRVPINMPVDEPTPIRETDGTTVIPVFEEVAVVKKQLMLKEELHITKVRSQVHNPQRVRLRRETVEIKKIQGPRIED